MVGLRKCSLAHTTFWRGDPKLPHSALRAHGVFRTTESCESHGGTEVGRREQSRHRGGCHLLTIVISSSFSLSLHSLVLLCSKPQFCVDLVDSKRKWVGVLHHPFEHLPAASQERTWKTHDLIEMLAGFVLVQGTESGSFEKSGLPGVLVRLGITASSMPWQFYGQVPLRIVRPSDPRSQPASDSRGPERSKFDGVRSLLSLPRLRTTASPVQRDCQRNLCFRV
jgi:hypothetical protein